MFITIWFSALFLDFKPSLTFLCGFFVCCISLLLYNVTPEWLASDDSGKPAVIKDAEGELANR